MDGCVTMTGADMLLFLPSRQLNDSAIQGSMEVIVSKVSCKWIVMNTLEWFPLAQDHEPSVQTLHYEHMEGRRSVQPFHYSLP